MLIKLSHAVQLSGRNHKWVMAAARGGCDIQACGYVLQALLSGLLWSAAFSPLLSCHGDRLLGPTINRQTSKAFTGSDHEDSPLAQSTPVYAYVCENCHLRLLPTKPVWQIAFVLTSTSVRELFLGGLDIRNRILNSGQPEAEGFTSSVRFQVNFCKLARLHKGSALQGRASFGVSVSLQSRDSALMPVVVVGLELRCRHKHIAPLSEHAHVLGQVEGLLPCPCA